MINLKSHIFQPSIRLQILKYFAPFLFVSLIFFGNSAHAFASSSWYWTTTGNLQTPKFSLQLITLQNGKVLDIGGNGTHMDSELYDPSTGAWTLTGSMYGGDDWPTSVLLQDGRVLVPSSYQIYDPNTNQWSFAGYPRYSHSRGGTSTLLPNGKVLVAGGNGDGFVGIYTDIYDPATGTYSDGGEMPTTRSDHIAVLLQNGKVLLAGGYADDSNVPTLSSALLYDPSTRSFTPTGSMNVPRYGASAALLPDGRVLVAGGNNGEATLASAEIYDPTSGTWTMTGSLLDSRGPYIYSPLQPLPNGNFLAVGGTLLGTSEEYNPSTGTWSKPVATAQPHCAASTALLSDGRVLIAGGDDCLTPDDKLATTEIYGVSNLDTVPEVSSLSGGSGTEGGYNYSESGSFTDPDSTSWTATVNYGDGSGTQPLTLSGMNFSLSHLYNDSGTHTVRVRVKDDKGVIGIGTTTVTINNVAPTVGAITAPSSPVLVNTAFTASANFTDPGVNDIHIASWNWGDGSTTGTVTESNGSGSVSDNHTYTATGVYTITLYVTDKDGGVGTSTYQYVAVYDSSTSFAGGRSFDNPATASPATSGKVSFGISSKYSNSNTLTGSVKMNFKAANLDFASTSLQSLATSNGKAYLTGSGTVNGSGSYTFLATGIDGSVVGGNDLIRFRIKDSSGNVVYDSQPGASDTTDPTTQVATGNIRVH